MLGLIHDPIFCCKASGGKLGIVGFSQCCTNTCFNRWKVDILPNWHFFDAYSLQEWIQVNYKRMWGRWYNFNCSFPGQLCIACLGLSVQTVLSICPYSDNCFSLVKIKEIFISGLVFFQCDCYLCGWRYCQWSVLDFAWVWTSIGYVLCRMHSFWCFAGFLLIWKAFFGSPLQQLTNMLTLGLEMYGPAFCEASYLANWQHASYSAHSSCR